MTQEQRIKSIYDCWRDAVNEFLDNQPMESYESRIATEKDHWVVKFATILAEHYDFTPKVKPLEWVGNVLFYRAVASELFNYEIRWDEGMEHYNIYLCSQYFESCDCNTQELLKEGLRDEYDAKAACEKHHQESVLSLLEI